MVARIESNGERISIAKAAKILGLDRRELCKRLCKAGFEGFEGAVDLDELKAVAPKMALQEDIASERARLARETARRRSAVQTPPKPEDELKAENARLHNQWLVERQRNREYADLFDAIVDELGAWQDADDENRARFARDFGQWICKRFT